MTRKILLVVLMALASVITRASPNLTQSSPGQFRLQQNNGSYSSIDKVFETNTEKTFAHI